MSVVYCATNSNVFNSYCAPLESLPYNFELTRIELEKDRTMTKLMSFRSTIAKTEISGNFDKSCTMESRYCPVLLDKREGLVAVVYHSLSLC